MISENEVYFNFYKIPRLTRIKNTTYQKLGGIQEYGEWGPLPDGGGPFGADIHHALEVCYLIDTYQCDAVLETGTNTGDTTEFLAKIFPNLKILTCDIEQDYLNIARDRLRGYKNVEVYLESSEKFLEKNLKNFNFPFIFLDAHWEDYWPLKDELALIKKGVVCVDDYDINVGDFNFDKYNDVIINEKLIKDVKPDVSIFTNNPQGNYAFPSMQDVPNQRRAGRGYFQLGKDDGLFLKNNIFKR